jgi:hypothetical protein
VILLLTILVRVENRVCDMAGSDEDRGWSRGPSVEDRGWSGTSQVLK